MEDFEGYLGYDEASKTLFKEIVGEHLDYRRVTWNGEVKYDFEEDDFPQQEAFQEEYNNRIVYQITIRFIGPRQCYIDVIGERDRDGK